MDYTIHGILQARILEKEMAIHSSILAWKIPWTEDPGGLQSMGSQRVDTTRLFESENESHLVVSSSLRPCGLYSKQSSLGQNTGVGSLSLLQGMFPTQGSNPGLPHCRRILYQLSHQGILEGLNVQSTTMVMRLISGKI